MRLVRDFLSCWETSVWTQHDPRVRPWVLDLCLECVVPGANRQKGTRVVQIAPRLIPPATPLFQHALEALMHRGYGERVLVEAKRIEANSVHVANVGPVPVSRTTVHRQDEARRASDAELERAADPVRGQLLQQVTGPHELAGRYHMRLGGDLAQDVDSAPVDRGPRMHR
eukprot:scaffold438_cov250-Pinguiococcus_pyrenoidosus.AAC.48